MSKISRLMRLEEAMKNQKALKLKERDQALHLEKIKAYASHPGHKKPVSRRDFLEAGVLSTVGYMIGPSIATIIGSLGEAAQAQVMGECPAPPSVGIGPAPFINLHLSGGYAPLAAATPRLTSGAKLASYTKLGLGTTPTFVNNIFANGAELFDNGTGAGFYRGLLAGAQVTTLSNAALVTVPLGDNGDSGDVTTSILGLVSRAGRAGSKLRFLRNGSDSTTTGVDVNPAFNIAVSTAPTNINSINDITKSVTLTGALSRLTNSQQIKLARAIQSLNSEQAARITGINGGAELSKLVYCATDQSLKNLAGGGAVLDPKQITGMSTIWNNFGTDVGDQTGDFQNEPIGAMVSNVLNGNAAGAAINVGGFDIHNADSRAGQEQGAFNIGRTVGRMLESARLLNTKVFVHITTNGAVVNSGGTPTDTFNDDDSNGNCFGASHFIMYDPSVKVATTSALPQQIGGLNQNGNVDKTVFTSNVNDAGAAVLFNYMLFSGLGEAAFDQTMAGIKTYSAAQKAIMRKVA